MGELIQFLKDSKKYVVGFFKWLTAGLVIGAVGGLVGVLFHLCVAWATDVRQAHGFLIWLLPLGGLAIAGLYSLVKAPLDTNIVINAVKSQSAIHVLMAPLIFVSSVVSHLFGASVGREGAALQIGGCIGYQYGRLCRMDDADRHIVVLCGMSAVFSALFGTPITAMLFPIEVISVGVMYYAALLPCVTASLMGSAVAGLLGAEKFSFSLSAVPALGVANLARTAILAVLCALLAVVFCVCLHRFEHIAREKVKNNFLRIAIGGALVAGLTWLVGTNDYNGAGTQIIGAAIGGQARPEAFVLKLVFTVLCVGVGYKGGEIVPTLFIGATFGCVCGRLLGLDPGFGAAVGMIALFCGMVNCPMSSVLLSIELFGAAALPYFTVACVISFMLSGKYSLYSAQSVIYSKVKAKYINERAR